MGQLIRNLGGERTRAFLLRYKPILKKISETSLLYIIFCAMSESFYNGLDASAVEIAVMFLIVLCIHISSLTLVWNVSGCRAAKSDDSKSDKVDFPDSEESERTVPVTDTPLERTGKAPKCKNQCMKFDLYDRIAILFCSSQKTAAFGIPIVTSLYETSPNLGIYLVPLLMYPPIQLVCDSLLVQPLSSRVAKWRETTKPDEESSLKVDTDHGIQAPTHIGSASTSAVDESETALQV